MMEEDTGADFAIKTQCPIRWVVDSQELANLCQQWSALPWLAVDTEFMRTSTFYPEPALIQLFDGEANYLLDPVAGHDLMPLRALMLNENVQKVMHACSEDLEVFQVLLKCLPVNVLDTQIAAAFCGYGYSVGYANLVKAVLGVDLPKAETRSNWLQRPLTEAQQEYAALDVEYLHELTHVLKQQLASNGREEWVKEECEQLMVSFLEGQKLSNASLRFKGAWRLNQRQLAALMELAVWRDKTAQDNNVVRSYVIRDKSLYAIAEMLPTHISQLRKVPEMSDKTIRRYGDTLIELVENALNIEPSVLPARLPRPPSSAQQAHIQTMREALAQVAEAHGIALEYLVRRKDFEFMMRARQEGKTGDAVFPASFNGWRAEFVKPHLRAFL